MIVRNGWFSVVRNILAIVVGYIVFVLGAWVVQESLLGGVSYFDPPGKLILAGLLTPVSAAIGAVVTLVIAGRRSLLYLLPMSALIVAETTYLYRSGRVDGPLWFEAAAGASLIIGAVVGALLWQAFRARLQAVPGHD